jgi:hypothetical protein
MCGLTVANEVVGRGTLPYTWQGREASLEPIILMAHQDVLRSLRRP